jgi:hypothetical protein
VVKNHPGIGITGVREKVLQWRWFGRGVDHLTLGFINLGSGPGCVVLGQRMGWIWLCLDLVLIIRVRMVLLVTKAQGPML